MPLTSSMFDVVAVQSRLAQRGRLKEARRVSSADAADHAVLYAVARGDRHALAQLYEQHAAVMLALAQRMLRDSREAEDVVHDVFVEAWRHAGEYDPTRSSVRSWLLLRLRSRCLDRLRSAGVKRVQLMAEVVEVSREDGELHRSDHGRIRAALDSLSSEQRAVLELGYFHGLSSKEIAENLAIPIGTVKSRVGAALAQLRRVLGADSGEVVS
jgi:RNA polymerase sigma-70 factor (ECF subfamily)